MKPWRSLESTTLFSDRWLTVRSDVCELPNGTLVRPYYVIEEHDWVQVFALASDGRVLTVRQYRYAGNTVCLELPGGALNDGESPVDAARRELLEETGFEASRWTPVATTFANPARQTNRIHVFLAQGLDAGGPQRLDQSEEIEQQFLTIDELRKASIRDGSFSQSLHIASFYLCLERLRLDASSA